MRIPRLISRGMLWLLRVEVRYRPESVEACKAGGRIIACNHVSLLDGVIVALASPVPMCFAVETAYARHHPVTRLGLAALAWLGYGRVAPVDAGSPFGIRTLARALAAGENVMIFPEGAISPDGRPQANQSGIEWLSTCTGASVIWLSISGAESSRLFAKAGRRLWPRILLEF